MYKQLSLCEKANQGSFFDFNWLEFEECCKQLLESVGRFQHVEVTKKGPHGGDGGVDLVMYASDGKIIAYGQCKQWQTRFKGLAGSIYALHRCMTQNRVRQGFLLVTTEANSFEKREAKLCNIEIIDSAGLERMLAKLFGSRVQKMNAKHNYNYKKYRTGRPGTDYVTDIRGQLNICVECGLEYSMEDALTKRWPLFGGHCELCSRKKTQ